LSPGVSPNNLNEVQLQVMRTLEAQSELTRHKLAKELVVGLGKAHYWIKALIYKGLVKKGNCSHSDHKHEYAHLLTPSAKKSKAMLTAHFSERKAAECPMLKSELEKYEKHINHPERGEVIKRVEEAVQ